MSKLLPALSGAHARGESYSECIARLLGQPGAFALSSRNKDGLVSICRDALDFNTAHLHFTRELVDDLCVCQSLDANRVCVRLR